MKSESCVFYIITTALILIINTCGVYSTCGQCTLPNGNCLTSSDVVTGALCEECNYNGFMSSNDKCICISNDINAETNCNDDDEFVEYLFTIDQSTSTCNCWTTWDNGFWKLSDTHSEKKYVGGLTEKAYVYGLKNPPLCDQCYNEFYGPIPNTITYSNFKNGIQGCSQYGGVDPSYPLESWKSCSGHGFWDDDSHSCMCDPGWTLRYIGVGFNELPVYTCDLCLSMYGPYTPEQDILFINTAVPNSQYCSIPLSPDPLDGYVRMCSGHGEFQNNTCNCYQNATHGYWELGTYKTTQAVYVQVSESEYQLVNEEYTIEACNLCLNGLYDVEAGCSGTVYPTTAPTKNPTHGPTKNPTVSPTVNPTTTPTISPTVTPSKDPTISPTRNPSVSPTVNPTANPTINPTLKPSTNPTINPTRKPTRNPSHSPTVNPTINPTLTPSKNPTISPTRKPTRNPSHAPTVDPTRNPSKNPTIDPTLSPSMSPTITPTDSPSLTPTLSPSSSPTSEPTISPSMSPTDTPSLSPTIDPTESPSMSPTIQPSSSPTHEPTISPSMSPTIDPTLSPSMSPTVTPTKSPSLTPTLKPSSSPTVDPTRSPSLSPTLNPTRNPTVNPTKSPTRNPTVNPTFKPTVNPTLTPTSNPTKKPTLNPTRNPTKKPTSNPTRNPTKKPTSNPTKNPTRNPTKKPTANPTTLTFGPTGYRTYLLGATSTRVVFGKVITTTGAPTVLSFAIYGVRDSVPVILKIDETGALDTSGFNSPSGYKTISGSGSGQGHIVTSGSADGYKLSIDSWGIVGDAVGYVARTSSAGVLDTTLDGDGVLLFGFHTYTYTYGMILTSPTAVNPGYFVLTLANGPSNQRGYVVKLLNNGGWDTSFNGGAISAFGCYECLWYALVISPVNSKLILVGSQYFNEATEAVRVTRISASSGALDTGFGTSGYTSPTAYTSSGYTTPSKLTAMAYITPTSTFVVCGYATDGSGKRPICSTLDENGSILYNHVGTGTNTGAIVSVDYDSGQNVIVVALSKAGTGGKLNFHFYTMSSSTLALTGTSGTCDFGNPGTMTAAEVESVIVQSDGKYLMCGKVTYSDTHTEIGCCRFRNTGLLDA